MRPFEKDSQPVVTKGRRKSKLAAPKSKSTTAVVKRKSRNARRKQNDEVNDLSKEPCHFVPVRRKPLGEYMKLEPNEPMASPSPSVPGMRMTYAAAVQTGSGVKVMISPRLNKSNKSGKEKVVKIIADTKFQIFDEQPKPHIVRVDPKAFRADVERKSRMKSPKTKKAITQKASKIHMELANKIISNDVDYKALQLKLKSNASGTTANNGNSLAIPNGKQTRSSAFVDSISYLSFHQARLQRIIQKQGICPITLHSPEPMKVPQFEDKHFKYLEEAALLAQNRSMLRLWMKSDRCSSK